MGNAYQISNQNGIYFVTLTIVEWIDVFTRPIYKNIIIESLQFCQKEKGLKIYAWVIMTNHLHMIIAADPGNSLSDILRDFKKFTANKIINKIKSELGESRRNWMLWIFKKAGNRNPNNRNYQFWRQDNHPEELFSEKFTDQKLEYIHNNPVNAGIVDKAEEYIYSSARDYFGGKGLLEIEFIYC
jgi:REP element-mobilizing transposase RayT